MKREELIKRIQSWNLSHDDMAALAEVIPELAESEDEKFRKYILQYCKECIEANDKGLELSMSTTKKLLDYLEKQKETLHISETCKENAYSFTDEDERIRKFLIEQAKFYTDSLEQQVEFLKLDGKSADLEIGEATWWKESRIWLEKQKDLDKMIVVTPEVWDTAIADAYENGKKDGEKQKEQKPVEWSEEDERMLSRCIKSVECSKQFADSESYKAAKDVEMNWLNPSVPLLKSKDMKKELEKEFEALWETDFGGKHFDVIGKTDLKEIVEHFYELGCLQTKKEIGEYCYSQLDGLNVCGNPIKLGKRDFLASIMDFCENGDNYPVMEDEPSWKPSEEQMTNLLRAEGRLRIEGESVLASKLAELYEQLKKL